MQSHGHPGTEHFMHSLPSEWMTTLDYSVGKQNKSKQTKAEVEREGEDEEQLAAEEMWWSCSTHVNADHPTWLFRFSSLWLLGAPTITTLRKLHSKRPCLTHV